MFCQTLRHAWRIDNRRPFSRDSRMALLRTAAIYSLRSPLGLRGPFIRSEGAPLMMSRLVLFMVRIDSVFAASTLPPILSMARLQAQVLPLQLGALRTGNGGGYLAHAARTCAVGTGVRLSAHAEHDFRSATAILRDRGYDSRPQGGNSRKRCARELIWRFINASIGISARRTQGTCCPHWKLATLELATFPLPHRRGFWYNSTRFGEASADPGRQASGKRSSRRFFRGERHSVRKSRRIIKL